MLVCYLKSYTITLFAVLKSKQSGIDIYNPTKLSKFRSSS